MLVFWFVSHVDLQRDANVSGKPIAFIFIPACRDISYTFPKRWHPTSGLHDFTTQRTKIDIFFVVRAERYKSNYKYSVFSGARF